MTSQCEWESLANRSTQQAIISTHSIMWGNYANFQVLQSLEERKSGGVGMVGKLWSKTAQ